MLLARRQAVVLLLGRLVLCRERYALVSYPMLTCPPHHKQGHAAPRRLSAETVCVQDTPRLHKPQMADQGHAVPCKV